MTQLGHQDGDPDDAVPGLDAMLDNPRSSAAAEPGVGNKTSEGSLLSSPEV